MALRFDITSEQDTLRMAEETVKAFHRIDILVNNAAMIYGITRKPFLEIPPEEWDRLMTVNLKGPFLCCRAVFPQMKRQGKGKIINLSSETAFTGSRHFVHSPSRGCPREKPREGSERRVNRGSFPG